MEDGSLKSLRSDELEFIFDILEKVGVRGKNLNLIKSFISTVSYKIVVNGETTDEFFPFCSLSQEEPISPYLFVLRMSNYPKL